MDPVQQEVPETGEFDPEEEDSDSPGCAPRRDPIKIKLKLPKPDEESSQEQSPMPRICDFCGRRFPNGKALGGHIRIHNAAMKNKAAKKPRSGVGASMDPGKGVVSGPARKGDQEKEQVCWICNKTFCSKKSLFGHMRAHPERTDRWGGPPSYEEQSSNSEESSDQEIEEAESCREHGEVSGSKVTDLLKGLPNWSKTDKRGRVSPFEAANCLVKMSAMAFSSHDRTNELLPRSNRYKYEPESPPKKLILEDRSDAEGRKGKSVRVQAKPAGSKGKEPAQNRTLRRKEGSLKNSIEEEAEEASRAKTGLSQDLRRVRFRCSTCGRNFPSFQALGGHRSSHNKEKGSTSASASAPARAAAPAPYNHQARPNCPGSVSEPSASTVNNAAAPAQTNNEEGRTGPSSTDASGGAYQCAICKMIFETLEALRDHNLRCERRGKVPLVQPGEASGQGDNRDQSSLDQNNKPSPGDQASQVGPRAPVFDLNEPPPEYDDGPVSQNQLNPNTKPHPDPPGNSTP